MLGPRVRVMKGLLTRTTVDQIQRIEGVNPNLGEMWNVRIVASLLT